MEQNSQVVLIGGTADGRRIKDPQQPELSVAVARWMPTPITLPLQASVTSPTAEPFEIERYRRERLIAGDRCFQFYVFNGITIEEAIERLLAGYRVDAAH